MTLLNFVLKAIRAFKHLMCIIKSDVEVKEPKPEVKPQEFREEPKRKSLLRKLIKVKKKFTSEQHTECSNCTEKSQAKDFAIALYFATIGLLIGNGFTNRIARRLGNLLTNRPTMLKWVIGLMAFGSMFSRPKRKRNSYA